MARKLVVICYAEADADGFAYLRDRLDAAFGGADVEILADAGAPGAAEWSAGIAKALQACDAFLLLVSPQSVSLPFAAQRIEALCERELAGEPPLIVAVVLTPTSEASLAALGRAARFPGDGKALSHFSPDERDTLTRRLAEALAHEILKSPAKAPVVETEASFLDWLRAQSPQVAVAIAARAALRALPLHRADGFRKTPKSDATLRSFLAAAQAWTAARRPEQANEGQAVAAAEAASAVDANASASAAYAAAFAASPDPSVYSSDAGVYANDAVNYLIEEGRRVDGRGESRAAASAWRALRLDVEHAARLTPEALAQAPLWPDEPPPWASAAWAEMRESLAAADGWQVWIDWYEDRLSGAERGEAHDLAFAALDPSLANRGARAVNAALADRLTK